MTYDDLKSIMEENFGTTRPADIAKELEVSPQVVNNWKSRDQVPYKYVKKIRKKIRRLKNPNANPKVESIVYTGNTPIYDELDLDEKSITQFILLAYRKIIDNLISTFAFPLIFLSLAILYNLYAERLFITNVNILPLSENQGLKLPSIVQQFGLGQASAGAHSLTSAQMYPVILKSKRLARMVLKHKFYTIKYDEPRSLVSIILQRNQDKSKWTEIEMKIAVHKLTRMIDVKKIRNSALLTMSVGTFEPQFSADLAQKIIDEFKLLLVSIKLQDKIEKEAYIENRIIVIRSDLIAAEEELKLFREKNRDIFTSPALTLMEERLITEVEVQKEIFITLKSQLEMVQIEMLGKKSMIQILDPPEAPLGMTKPNKRFNIYFAIIFGFTISFSFIIVKDWYIDNKKDLKLS